ncbi:unnamed protein product [Phytomonas sp. EM1]|nr:unnamed protein product [Phytomonas sp. EM1]|eukprot:CCW65001.1 unnamed protein product [Phytomonas sp. isolate EM1]
MVDPLKEETRGPASSETPDPSTLYFLPLVDHWAQLVLNECRLQGFTPDPNFCAWLERYSPPSSITAEDQKAASTVEESLRISSPCSQDAYLEGSEVYTASGKPFRLPYDLLSGAYRLRLPCLHYPLADNEGVKIPPEMCDRNPCCTASLQKIRPTPSAIEDYLNCVMGGAAEKPIRSPFCTTEKEATTIANEEKGDRSAASTGGGSLLRVLSDQTATTTITPDSPCLWRGIMNLGNTCYLSSTLMLLYTIPALRQAILRDATDDLTEGPETSHEGSFSFSSSPTAAAGSEEGGNPPLPPPLPPSPPLRRLRIPSMRPTGDPF